MPERDLPERERFTPEERDPEIEGYNVAPPDMPPSPAGADAEIGGEAAASRRFAGSPTDPRRDIHERAREVADIPEPFLGYDGLPLDDIIEWIDEEDPGPGLLRQIIDYEMKNRERDRIVDECAERIERWNGLA